MGQRYFTFDQCRRHSRAFYAVLPACIVGSAEAEVLTRQVIQESPDFWNQLQGGA